MADGLAISIDIKNLDVTETRLKTIGDRLLTGMGPALEEVGKAGSEYFAGVAFQSKGSAFSNPWAPLAKATVVDKTKHWPGRPDMVRTQAMRNSFTYTLGPNEVRLGNSATYFKYHQSTEERKKIPRRQMIGVNTQLQGIVLAAFKKQVDLIIAESKI